MKTAKPVAADGPSSRRAQPVRQTRINPPRAASYSRSFAVGEPLGRSNLSTTQNAGQQVAIFPAISHFADAITALPKELVRHFTLLKEVDAKIYVPEGNLDELVEEATSRPLPRRSGGPVPALGSAAANVEESLANGQGGPTTVGADHGDYDPAFDPDNVLRRQLFRKSALTMQEILVSLDEKNHVISTAVEACNKQLARINECFPHIENEISEEARWGSDTHWAYAENRINKANTDNRVRRDVAAPSELQAAQILAEQAAARTEARKQAMLAKKNRNPRAGSDFDDTHEGKHKEPVKKLHGNSKAKKAAEAANAIGLGITNGTSTNGHVPQKRRKIDKTPNNATASERPSSAAMGTVGTGRGRGTNSPRETPVPEGSRKRGRGGGHANGGAGRKRNSTITSVAMSPSLASSPIQGTFPDPKTTIPGSPAPPNAKPLTGRGRQNSTQSLVDTTRQAAALASSKPNGTAIGTPDLASVASATGRSVREIKATMRDSAQNTGTGEHMVEDIVQEGPEIMKGGPLVGARKPSLKREELDMNGVDAMQGVQASPIPAQVAVVTKSGRASKPSTPAMANFPEPMQRSRSSRGQHADTSSTGTSATNKESSGGKRSHKKGAGQTAVLAARVADDDGANSSVAGEGEDEDAEIDADEPRYCYCNGVSYGEMVGCDANNCSREWFHLECVGLKTAPKGNAKWYCDDCKENMKNSKRFNGR